MMRATIYCSIFIAITLTTFSPLLGDDIWGPYVELEGRVGGTADSGQLKLFAPLSQGQGSILFGDFRAQVDDTSGSEGNLGLAYRKLLQNSWKGEDVIFGVNGYFDFSNTQFDNEFAQGGFGLELLTVTRGARFNAYFPEGDLQTTGTFGGTPTAVLVNDNIFISSGLSEGAFRGLDFEYEELLWSRHHSPENSGIVPDVEVWVSAGVFHFDAEATGLEDFTGPRLRTELRLLDTPLLGNDSRVVLTGQYDYDEVRGSQGTATVAVRIPLRRASHRTGQRLSQLARRMVDPIRRQNRIVTNTTGTGGLERALIARTGRQIESATVIDANSANPSDAITNAGTDSVVILDGSAGDVLISSAASLSPGQTVIGGGSDLELIGADSGAAVTFTTPGSVGQTILGPAGTFNLATDSTIDSLLFDIGGATVFNLNNANNALIDNVVIDFNGDVAAAGPLFLIDSQNSQVTLSSSAFSATTALVDGGAYALINAQNSQVTLDNSSFALMSNSTVGDIIVAQNSQVTLSSSVLSVQNSNSVGDIIVAQDSQIDLLNSSLASSNANESDGITLAGNSRLLLDTTILAVGGPNGNAIVASDSSRFDVNISDLSSFGDAIVASDNVVFAINFSEVDSPSDAIVASGNSRFSISDSAFDSLQVSSGGTVNATITDSVFSSVNVVSGAGDVNFSVLGLEPQLGGPIATANFDASGGGAINVTQGSPGSGAGSIDTLNPGFVPGGITTLGTVNFNQPPPTLP